MGAFADLHHIKFRFDTGFFSIGFVQRLNKQVYGIIFYDTDRTSAESAAGDTGAKDARYVPCQLRQKIRLYTGSLIIVPQRDVGIIDEFSEGLDVVCLQGFHRMDRAPVLIDGMLRTFSADRILDGILILFELLFRQVSQRLDVHNGLQCL